MAGWLSLLLFAVAAQQLPAGEQQPGATRLRPTAVPSSGQGIPWAEYADPHTAATRFKVRLASELLTVADRGGPINCAARNSTVSAPAADAAALLRVLCAALVYRVRSQRPACRTSVEAVWSGDWR